MAKFLTAMRVETLAWLRVNHVPLDDDPHADLDLPKLAASRDLSLVSS